MARWGWVIAHIAGVWVAGTIVGAGASQANLPATVACQVPFQSLHRRFIRQMVQIGCPQIAEIGTIFTMANHKIVVNADIVKGD